MRQNIQELIRLQLRQARRRERPWLVAKVWLVCCIALGLLGVGCGCLTEQKDQQQQQKTNESLWSGHAEAMRNGTKALGSGQKK